MEDVTKRSYLHFISHEYTWAKEEHEFLNPAPDGEVPVWSRENFMLS